MAKQPQHKDKETLIGELVQFAILGDTARNVWWDCLTKEEQAIVRQWLRDEYIPPIAALGANNKAIMNEVM